MVFPFASPLFPSPACGRRWRAAPDEGAFRAFGAPSSAFGTSLRAPAPAPRSAREKGEAKAAACR